MGSNVPLERWRSANVSQGQSSGSGVPPPLATIRLIRVHLSEGTVGQCSRWLETRGKERFVRSRACNSARCTINWRAGCRCVWGSAIVANDASPSTGVNNNAFSLGADRNRTGRGEGRIGQRPVHVVFSLKLASVTACGACAQAWIRRNSSIGVYLPISRHNLVRTTPTTLDCCRHPGGGLQLAVCRRQPFRPTL